MVLAALPILPYAGFGGKGRLTGEMDERGRGKIEGGEEERRKGQLKKRDRRH